MVSLPDQRSDRLLRMLRGCSGGLLAKPRSAKEYRREEPQRGKVKNCDRMLIDDGVEDRLRRENQTSGLYMGMRMMQLVMESAGSTRPGAVVSGPMAWHMSNWKREEMDSRHLPEMIDALCFPHLRCRCLRHVPTSELPLSPCYRRSLTGR